MKNEATVITMANVKQKMLTATAVTTKVAVGVTVATASTSALSAGLSDAANNGMNFGVLLMNVVLVLAACGGAFLAVSGLWSLRPGNQQNQKTPGQSWGLIGVGILLVNALWLINEGSQEFTDQQSTTFNQSVNNGSGS